MAYSYWKSIYLGFLDPKETIPRIKAAALEAVKLDDTMAEAHAVLGLALGTGDFDWTGAKQEFQRALELDAVSPDIHYFAAALAFATGRVEEALSEIQHAVKLDPLSAHFNACLGTFYIEVGQHDRAIAQCRLAIELDPNLWFAYWQLALACLNKGLPDEAIATVEKGIKLFGRYSCLLLCLGFACASTGRIAEARELLEELKTRDRATYVPPSIIGWIHLALGEIDHGLEWFARAVEEHDLLAVFTFKSEASLAPLRPHPAFQALLRKMNLAP
jgi:serine/threonine-protein kinase